MGETTTFKGRLCAVVGAGRSGRAAARLLDAQGARVRVLERDPDGVPDDFAAWAGTRGVEIAAGEHGADQFRGASLVVLSPGIVPHLIRPLLPDPAPPVMAELELAWRCLERSGNRGRVLAVTGTNGKTTTTALAAHVLRTAGWDVFEGGNIGTPLSEHVLAGHGRDARTAQVLVLEVSSFQAMGLDEFRPEVAALLNFSANHLDWHADLEEYLWAKLRIFARMDGEDLALVHESLRPLLEKRTFTGARLRWFGASDRFECPSLPGEHNQANMEAAYQATRRFGIDERDMRDALATFTPHPHRLQQVGELGGVTFVDDSKSTTLESLRAALESFDRPVLLMAGGVFKGGDPGELRGLVERKVKAVGLFGDSREVFEAAWSGVAPVAWSPNLRGALAGLMAHADPGDVVLLSPATASFDLYADYKARGRDFQDAVRALSTAREAS